jgi:hypothetical protein
MVRRAHSSSLRERTEIRGGFARHARPYLFEGLEPGNVKGVSKKMRRRYSKVEHKYAVFQQVRINSPTQLFFKGGNTCAAL